MIFNDVDIWHYTIDDFRWGEYKDNTRIDQPIGHGIHRGIRNWKSLTVLLYDIKSNLN